MRKLVTISALFSFIVLLTFLPRLLSLSAHWSSDESLWMLRSRSFFFALQSGRFSDTYITHHPGVTTSWLGSVAVWNVARRDVFPVSWFYSDQFLSPEMLARIRFPITVMTGILVLVAGALLYRLLGRITGGIGTLFLAIEPFLLAESRRAHTDALTSLFLFSAVLSWLYYLESKTQSRRVLIFSGICFGFACLTKSLAGAFLLFLPILLVWYVKQNSGSWLKMLWSGLFFCCVSLYTVLVVWPYMWTLKLGNIFISPLLLLGCLAILIWIWDKLSDSQKLSLNRTELFAIGCGGIVLIGAALYVANPVLKGMYHALTVTHGLPKLFLGDVRYDLGILYYPVMWFVWSGPLTLLLIGAGIYLAWQQRHSAKKEFRVTIALVAFTLFYLLGLSLVAKKIARYIIIFLPALCVLSTMGALNLSKLFAKQRWKYLFLATLILLQVAPIVRLHPYYQTYYFPLLSGKWVAENASNSTGIGLDLAADYLNTKQNAKDLQVRTTLFSEDLNKYFRGKTWLSYDMTPSVKKNIKINYEVEYLRDKQLQGTPIDFPPKDGVPHTALQRSGDIPRELEHLVRLNGIDYVWVYRVLEKETQ